MPGAASEFPRGWTISSDNGGAVGATSITVPAVPGIVHVLDSFDAKMFNATAAVVGALITLTSSDGIFAAFPLGRLDAAAGGTDSASGSGLGLAAGPGASLTIAYSNGVSGVAEFLVIQGHDI